MSAAFRELAVAAHLLGAILWIGGIATAAVVAIAGAREEGAARAATLNAARRAVTMVATPGLAIAWIAGLSYLVPNFTTLFARAGWMHGKLTLLVVVSALTGVFTARLRKAATGAKPPSVGLFAAVALVAVLGATIIAFLAELQPG